MYVIARLKYTGEQEKLCCSRCDGGDPIIAQTRGRQAKLVHESHCEIRPVKSKYQHLS